MTGEEVVGASGIFYLYIQLLILLVVNYLLRYKIIGPTGSCQIQCRISMSAGLFPWFFHVILNKSVRLLGKMTTFFFGPRMISVYVSFLL